MPLIRYKDKVVLFVHIPKTGGTSIEDAMTQSGAVVALRYGSRFKGFMKTTFQHLNADIYSQVIPPDFYDYAFALSRHPVSRLVSEYFYRRKRGDKERPFDEWVHHALDTHARTPYGMDNHIRPQVDFLIPDVAVFRIEDGIAPALEAAAVHLGLTLAQNNPHTNHRDQHDPLVWSPATRARAMSFYAADFDRFGYDPEQDFADIKLGKPRRRFWFLS